MPTKNPDLVAIGEAAKLIGVSIATLHRWEKEGKVTPIRLVPNGKRFYKIQDVVDLKK